MKTLAIAGGLALCCAAAQAADLKPFVMVDTSTEKDALAYEYINANVLVGVKAQNKMEYSLKFGGSEKTSTSGTETYSRSIEAKIKKSFDVGLPFSPYVSFRLGDKTDNSTSKSSSHWAADAGLKMPVTERVALDVGVRYKDTFNSTNKAQSTRYHVMGLYEIDPSNVIGLRYTTSTSSNNEHEDRTGWRVHYQHNY